MGLLPKAAALAALMLCFGVAQAQAPRAVELPAKAPFKHRHSKIQLPPVLAGLPRSGALEYEGDQLDTASTYATPQLSEAYTVYIYRNVAGGVPIWFDRARWMLERRGEVGTATLHDAGQFVPPGQSTASGLLATYALSGKAYRSTGVALLPVGEWLVKMRASSQTLSAGELEARMKSALAEIAWPGKIDPAPAAAPVAACATGLALSGNAKPAPKDESSGAAMLFSALLGQAGSTLKAPGQAAPPKPVRWCRDSTELASGAVYRADGRTDGYLIALGDAGRAVIAGPNAARALMESDKKKPGGDLYEVQLIFLAQTSTSALLDRLPPPEQALAIAGDGPFATSFATWGKDKGKLTVGPEIVK